MVSLSDTKELLIAVALIAGFSIAGFFIEIQGDSPRGIVSLGVEEISHGVPLVANPVVRIAVPAHNIFAPN